MIKQLLFISFLSVNLFANAQENIPIESWRMHISYNSVNYLVHGNNKIFAATNNGVFYIDKEDNSINTITKMDGLSDVGISSIGFSEMHSSFLIGYENGNIDVWKEGEISNINTVLNAVLTQSKKINHFNVNAQHCYISTDFGVLILNLDDLVIEESLQNLGNDGNELTIHESTIYNDSLFLATQFGIIAASLSPSLNILDYNNWQRYGTSIGAPETGISSITTYKNKIYAAEQDGSIYSYDSKNWILQPYSQNLEHNHLFSTDDNMIITSPTEVLQFDGTNTTTITSSSYNSNYAIIDNGSIWIADNTKGLLTNQSGAFESILPEGPFSDVTKKLYYHDNKVFALSGGINASSLPQQNNNGFYVFENGFWNNFNATTHPDVVKNLTDIIFNPSDQYYYLASYGAGLLKYDGDATFEIINSTNSPLETWNLNPNHTLVSSVNATSGGLWAGNYGTNNVLHNYSSSNTWSSFSQSTIGTNAPLEIEVAENGDKWIRIDPVQGGGIAVFNEGTGKARLLNKDLGNGDLPLNNVNDIEFDKEGLIWTATGRGVAYFTSTYSIENQNSVNAITPIVNGFPLLRDEQITVIAIDGGNRKWFGSDNGLWLFDANAQKQIYYFNTDNSPLISNNITDIAIHEKSGEVFIATEKGMVSFRSPATEGTTSNQSVKIFPNPVVSTFEGIVGISGLAQNNVIKITDISGKLIRQMRANGGTASWDVRDYNGRRASTGMYLVFSASDDGEETFVGKIAIVE